MTTRAAYVRRALPVHRAHAASTCPVPVIASPSPSPGAEGIFAVDYRLAGPDRPTWNKAPQDLVSALSWVQKNAAEYGIDSSRTSLGGDDAYGSLTSQTGRQILLDFLTEDTH
ncbi:alpha/beta hydrolase [Streptomyces sp. NPDC101194]|uniref:alpha/beta hydrolase n=1 Tax=Streptomyces sp. NPDC101194 TaxID=3366127 RepID=UPI003806C48B